MKNFLSLFSHLFHNFSNNIFIIFKYLHLFARVLVNNRFCVSFIGRGLAIVNIFSLSGKDVNFFNKCLIKIYVCISAN